MGKPPANRSLNPGLIASPNCQSMLYCLNPDCPSPINPQSNVHCQYCGVKLALRDRFKSLKPIGQGGFGATYLAKDLHNRSKPCVIKRLTYQGPSPQATAKAQQLFEQEAERLDQLIHPQIPRLVAYFEESGYLYLVQEFIEGKNLQAELAKAGTFNEAQIRALLHGLLPILQFVHSRNIIHRDLKPDNIMRRPNGDLVLIDFGVAKLLAQSGIASFGAFGATTIGTPGYASPEQMQGRVTPASDLFALGATCYQLLTNRFADGQTSLVGYSWTQNWQKSLKQPISDELAALLTRLIATEECDRYPTATAVLRDLSPSSPPLGERPATPQGLMSSLPTVVAQPPTPAPTPAPAKPAQPLRPAVSPAPISPAPISPAPISPAPLPPAPLAPPPITPSAPSPSPPLPAQQIGVGFCIKYGFLTYLGQTLGLFSGMVAVAFLATMAGMDSDTDMPAVLNFMKLAYWPASGITIGITQWLALRKWVPNALLWVPATMAMFWAIALIRVTISSPSFLPLALFVGALLALPQWWVIRQRSSRAIAWIPWIAVMSTLLFRVLIKNDFLTMFSWGLIGPCLDSLFLMWILRKPAARLTPIEKTAEQSAN